MIVCDNCGSNEIEPCGQTMDGRIVYECLSCGIVFTDEPEEFYDEEIPFP